jgi:uncharacterized membrane protein
MLKEYEDISPGFADRIIRMAENQSRHRQAMEAIIVKKESRDSRLGLWFGFIIGSGAIAGSVFTIMHGHDVAGAILGGGGLSSLVSVFVYGSKLRAKQIEAAKTSEKQHPNE